MSDTAASTMAPNIVMLPTSEVERHAHTILELVKLEDFRSDVGRQVQAFHRMQAFWGQLSPALKLNIRSRVSEALAIPEARFDWLMRMEDTTELRLALRYTPIAFQRAKDEQVYPEYGDGWLGAYLRYSEIGEAHVGWHFWAGIVALAAACRRNFFMLTRHKRMFPNLYVMFEGASGYGKNTSIELAEDLLRHFNKRIVERAGRNPDMGRVLTVTMLPNKMTPPILTKMLKEGQKLDPEANLKGLQPAASYEHVGICIAPEGSTLLGKDNFGADQLIVLLTQAYDGSIDDVSLNRADSRLGNVTLSLLIGSTMSWLRENITATTFQGGFMGARCLVIPKGLTGRDYPDEPVIDPVQRMVLADTLCEYAEHPPTEMVFSPGAQALYSDWYMSREKVSDDDRISGYYSRKRVYIKKLAMLFALSRHHIPNIEAADVESAIHLLNYEEPPMLACFRQVLAPGNVADAEWLLSVVRLNGGRLKRSELARRAVSRIASYRLNDVLSDLLTREVLGMRSHKNKRGPTTVWYYIPTMWLPEGKGDELTWHPVTRRAPGPVEDEG